MKYLCLIYQNEETSARNARQAVPMSQEYFAFTEEIQKSGHMLGGNALQPPNTATTVRVRSAVGGANCKINATRAKGAR